MTYVFPPKKKNLSGCSSHNAGTPQEGIDTSDAAYEKRHRKYETFEKRQRLREKEKLKHEQYKLKERIEQLRALEPSAFLNVADSFFVTSLYPPPHEHEHEHEHDARTTTNGNGNGNALHCDGEWRKRQILEVANSLEARYRTLLDTAPSRAPEQPTPTPTPTPAPVPPPKLTTPVPTPNHAPTPAPASPVVPRPKRVLPLPEPDEIIELDSDGEEQPPQRQQQSPERVKVESALQSPSTVAASAATNEALRLRIRFPTVALPSPSSAAVVSASGSPSPTRPRPKPIFKNPAAPGPYARVPFARRVSLQDVVPPVSSSSAPATPSPSVPHAVPAATSTAPASPAPTTLPTLRRRPARAAAAAAAHSKPVGTIALTTPAPAPSPPPAHAHSLRRPRKRRRVEHSEDGPSPMSDDYDNKGAGEEETRGVTADAEEEGEGEEKEEPQEEEDDDDDEGEEDEDEDEGEEGGEGGRRRGGTREQRSERWKECALYREAQRHAGTPNARKTHRHLGIFGLRGFPAEIEHMRDFVLPEWALPQGDLRLEQDDDADVVLPVVGEVRDGGETPHVGVVEAEGVDRKEAEAGLNQAHLDAVMMEVAAVAEDLEKTLLELEPGGSHDPMVTVESPKTVDSQETEDLMLSV
jgi:hypothetical protein